MTRQSWRFRLVATCSALTALAFAQSPGLVAADTKLDLTQDPWGFLSRALHLWNQEGFFGQLQNQAYGYLFPMGPFFGVLHSLGVPAWVSQRVWWSVLLCAAFLGAVRAARLLGVAAPSARWAAGLAFALAPRMVTTLGPISSEALAVAVAPWVLIPLLEAARGSSRIDARRAGALSGVAVLCAGGVNAVATAAALVLPALYLATRSPGPGRRALAGWWAAGVSLASLWWAVPLLVLGRYSPPFLDWIESAAVTTGRSDAATALRGTDDWVAYVSGPGGPSWPAGWELVSSRWLIVATGALAAVGLAGAALARRDRRFLLLGVLVGLVLVTLGHTGPVSGLGSGALQQALDGVLSPLRNTHKFDVVIRLPLAVGLGWSVMAAAQLMARRARTASLPRTLSPVVVSLLIALAAWPVLAGSLTRDRTFAEIPAYWREAADYVATRGPGAALVVPGAPFGTYLWGRPQDEPMQVLASAPWAVRDAVPLSSAGNIRLLDGVEARLASGRGSAGLAEALARSGVRWLVVRNDLDTVESQAPRAILVHEALNTSPGIRFAAGFGPLIVPFGTERTVVDYRLDAAYPAVEVYSVRGGTEPDDPRAVLRAADPAVSAPATTSDALVDLADARLLAGRTAVLGYAAPGPLGTAPVVIDSYRRAEHDFGRVQDSSSATMTPDQAWMRDRRVHDYPGGPMSSPVTAQVEGVASVSASSSQSDVGTIDGTVPGAGPWAAADLDLATGWQVRDIQTGEPSWWEAVLTAPTDVRGLRLALLADPVMGTTPPEVTVVTDAGRVTTALAAGEQLQEVPVPAGLTSTLRLELAAPRSAEGVRVLGLREVVVPGLVVGRPATVPPGDGSAGVVLSAREGARDGCAVVPLRFPCAATLVRPGEDSTAIDRVVRLEAGGTYDVDLTVRQRSTAGAGRLLDPVVPAVRASASSTLVGDPRSRAQAAVDRDPSTAWIAAVGDSAPTLTLALPEERTITGLQLQTEPDVAASRPFLISVTAGGRTIETAVDETGAAALPAVRTDSVVVRFRGVSPLSSVDLQRGLTTVMPVGVSEVLLRGALDLGRVVDRGSPTGVACGFGPVVEIDGAAAAQTRVATTVGAVQAGQRIAASSCSTAVRLSAGEHRIRVRSTTEFSVVSLVLRPAGTVPPAVPATAASILHWTAVDRAVQVSPETYPRTLETAENANLGWTAELDGQPLTAVVVDGWRQGWILPAGAAGEVRMEFGPDRLYRAGLGVGAAAAVLLAVLVLLPVRRPRTVPAAGPARAGRFAGSGLTVLAVSLVVGGAVGVVAAAAGVTLARLVPPARAAGSLALAAALVAAVTPWPASAQTAWPGAVASALVVAAVAAAAWPVHWPRRRPQR